MPPDEGHAVQPLLVEALRSVEQRRREELGTRYTDRVEFVFTVPEADNWGGALPHLSEELIAGVESDLTFEIRDEGVGRGAEGLGIAIVVVGSATAAAGGILTWLSFAREVAKVWRRFRERAMPILSVGALKMACVVDLAQRLGSMDDVFFVGSGDAGGSEGVDTGYTGEDYFTFIFRRRVTLFIYVVNSYGRLVHFGSGTVDPTVEREYLYGTAERQQFQRPQPPPFLAETE